MRAYHKCVISCCSFSAQAQFMLELLPNAKDMEQGHAKLRPRARNATDTVFMELAFDNLPNREASIEHAHGSRDSYVHFNYDHRSGCCSTCAPLVNKNPGELFRRRDFFWFLESRFPKGSSPNDIRA